MKEEIVEKARAQVAVYDAKSRLIKFISKQKDPKKIWELYREYFRQDVISDTIKHFHNNDNTWEEKPNE